MLWLTNRRLMMIVIGCKGELMLRGRSRDCVREREMRSYQSV